MRTPLKSFALDDFIKSLGFKSPQEYREALASFIVAFERVFPGGTYAFLGRDTAFLADAVEAFYISVGQKNRVVRIDISGSSLINPPESEDVAKFLSQVGLNLRSSPHLGSEFVILDYTTFSSDDPSQSYYLYRSAVKYMMFLKISREEIVKRLNVGTLNGNPDVDLFDSLDLREKPENFKRRQLRDLQSGRRDVQEIAFIGDSSAALLTYSDAWNGTYGPIRKVGGRYQTRPKSSSSVKIKREIFSQIVNMIGVVSSLSFQEEVMALAKKYNVVIEIKKSCRLISTRLE